MAHSPHRRWRGCCIMCAPWLRGDGKAKRMPYRDRRKLGALRRLTRPGREG